MRRGTRIKLVGAVAAGVFGMALASAPSALAFKCNHILDKFNRPNSTTLGSTWTERSAGLGIQNHRAANPSFKNALATYNGVESPSACVNVYANGATVQYVAIVLGYRNLKNNIFIKVQDNFASGKFTRAYAYRGNNGSGGDLVGNYYEDLTPFQKAEIYVTWSGSTVKLLISTLFNNQAQQKFVIHGVSTAGLGKRIGLAVYNGALADNFAIP
jgi:hypothetical protein